MCRLACTSLTVDLLERRRRPLVEGVDDLRASFRATHAARSFELLAIVVLPDHLHCLWRLPSGDAENANRRAQIESYVSRCLPMEEWRSDRRTPAYRAWHRTGSMASIQDAQQAYESRSHGRAAREVDASIPGMARLSMRDCWARALRIACMRAGSRVLWPMFRNSTSGADPLFLYQNQVLVSGRRHSTLTRVFACSLVMD